MVIAAWITGVIVFILSLISFWGMALLYFLLFMGVILLLLYTGFDPLSNLEEDTVEMFIAALIGPWLLVFWGTIIINIIGFFEDVGKSVKNMANDDRRR